MSQKVARIYLRVSSGDQDTERQKQVIQEAKAAGYYIAAVYTEHASGARSDRPELTRMISDIQNGDIIIAEKMDRISRLPLPEAEILIEKIKDKGAKLAIPGVTDLTDLINDATATGVSKIVLEAIQNLLLKLALQMSREEYETRKERQKQGIALAKKKGLYRGRRANTEQHELILKLRQHNTIAETARLAGCSVSQVKRICAINKRENK